MDSLSARSLSFRFATPQDAVRLAEIGALTFEQAFGADNTPEDMQAYLRSSFSPEIMRHEMEEPGAVFLIAELEGPYSRVCPSTHRSRARLYYR